MRRFIIVIRRKIVLKWICNKSRGKTTMITRQRIKKIKQQFSGGGCMLNDKRLAMASIEWQSIDHISKSSFCHERRHNPDNFLSLFANHVKRPRASQHQQHIAPFEIIIKHTSPMRLDKFLVLQ